MTWVARLMRWCPIAESSLEVVKFDTQLMQHPEIEGVDYQQGTLAGYEVREYLLEKWGRRCAYCGATNVPLQIEHILCRARGGTHRPSNLTLACEPCNVAKGTHLIEDFLQDQPDVLSRMLAQAKAPLGDAAAVNAMRWALYERLTLLGLPLECGTGGRTKYNRVTQDLPKTHWIDAACVGATTPAALDIRIVRPLLITATGHGSRLMCRMDKYGFPRTGPKQSKRVKGFGTGDLVRAVVPKGKKIGTYVGRVAVRATGSFNITTQTGTIQGISYKDCRLMQRCDGYTYQLKKGGSGIPPTAQPLGILPHSS